MTGVANPPAAAAEAGSGFADRHWRALLAGVLAVALAVRIAMLLSLLESPYGAFLLWDERTYDRWARHLLDGRPYYLTSLSPLPAYVTALVYRITGPAPLAMRLVNVGLGLGTCACLFAIGRRVGGAAVGLAAALGGALYQPMVFLDVTLLKEPLGLLLFAALVALVLAESEGHRSARALLLGAIAGLLVNVRPNAAVVLVVTLPWIAWRIRRRTGSSRPPAAALLAIAAGFAVATAPFAAQNLRFAGAPSPVPLGGFDLYRGNLLDGASPYYNPVAFSSSDPDTQGIEFTVEASRRIGRRLTAAEASAYWTGEVVRAARARPGAFARRLLEKALAAVHGWEEGDDHSLAFLRQHVGFLRFPLFPYWLVMPLGMAGLCLLAARRDGRAVAMLLVVAAYVASMAIVFPNMRIRIPIVILLLPYAAAGVLRAAGSLRVRRAELVVWAGAVLVFSGLELVPVRGAGDLTAHFNTHAAALMAMGREEEAVRWWRRSSEAQGSWSHLADLSLASLALAHGDRAEAWRTLGRVPDDGWAAPMKHALAGSLLLAEGRRREAVLAYERSLALDSAQLGTVEEAIAAAEPVDPARARAWRVHLDFLRESYGPLAEESPPVDPGPSHR